MIRDVYQVFGIATREELEAMQRTYLARNFGLDVKHAPGRLTAYVNHGRWIADCPCANGVLCSPADKTAICMECGLEHNMLFPTEKKRQDAQAILAHRPKPAHRNWRPDVEEPAELARENRDRGLKDA